MRSPAAGADLRAPALALVAWAATLGALHLSGRALLVIAAVAALGVTGRRLRRRSWHTAAVWLLTGAGVALTATLRIEAVSANPVPALARDRASVVAEVVTTSDPITRHGRFADYVTIRARSVQMDSRGRSHRLRVPLLLWGDHDLAAVRLGSSVRVSGRLATAYTDDLAAVINTRGPPQLLKPPGPLFRAADGLRGSIRSAVSGQPSGPRALVPALVDGDDGALSVSVADDFRTSGLTHLLAVSGTNLTLVVGFLLILARWAGVRARGLVIVGVVGVAAFILLARTEPSVLRAAAMGSVALLGMGSHGRRRGSRALGVAVFVLLLLDPWLTQSIGFALSTAATAGILWLAPGWRDALHRWCPLWVAEAVSVPLAAQLACTPLVAAVSGQVSLVAVAANLLAAPAVGPATVLGLLGGVVGLGGTTLGRIVALPAAWCATWIIAVAERAAALPVAAVAWPTRAVDLTVLSLGCAFVGLMLGALLVRPIMTVVVSSALLLAMLFPVPRIGWPPAGWVMVACDVGQGDGIVLNAGQGGAVVVDAGPDPRPMDRCLDRLGVRHILVVVLTHFHADHVDGLAGVLSGRRVDRIEVSSLGEPSGGVRLVHAVASRAGVPVREAAYGEVRQTGLLHWQVIAPSAEPPGDSDSPPNDASVVLLVSTRGVRLLLLGDEEQPSQERLFAETGGVRADVLKVAHHGSASQDPDLVRATGARIGVVSVGADNDYGHPAPSLLALLHGQSMRVARTDQDGDVAVAVRGGLRVVTAGHRG